MNTNTYPGICALEEMRTEEALKQEGVMKDWGYLLVQVMPGAGGAWRARTSVTRSITVVGSSFFPCRPSSRLYREQEPWMYLEAQSLVRADGRAAFL